MNKTNNNVTSNFKVLFNNYEEYVSLVNMGTIDDIRHATTVIEEGDTRFNETDRMSFYLAEMDDNSVVEISHVDESFEIFEGEYYI